VVWIRAKTESLGSKDPWVVGQYRFLAKRGDGGFGRVYLADNEAGELVAVKVLKDGSEQFVERFQKEAERAGAVAGLYTIQVLEFGVDDETPWLAMQFVDGPNLGELATGRPLPPDQVTNIAFCMATGLVDIHAAGLVHRDLNPNNVIVSDTELRIVDFGIAKDTDRTTSTLIGEPTPRYLQPEALQNEQNEPQESASDVFSWAATVCFLAQGRHLFNGTTAAIHEQILHPPYDIPDLSDPLDRLVRSALEREPNDRPSASEITSALFGHVDPEWHLPTEFLDPKYQIEIPPRHPDPKPKRRSVLRRRLRQAVLVWLVLIAGAAIWDIAFDDSPDYWTSMLPPTATTEAPATTSTLPPATTTEAPPTTEAPSWAATAGGLGKRTLAEFGDSVWMVESSGCGLLRYGSAFFIDSTHLVTNNHIVSIDGTPKLFSQDGRELEGVVIGGSNLPDVAVIEVSPAQIGQPLVWAEAESLDSSMVLTVLGYDNRLGPNSALAASVTQVVDQESNDPWQTAYWDPDQNMGVSPPRFTRSLITDSAVGHGLSGAPAITTSGQVAGIITELHQPHISASELGGRLIYTYDYLRDPIEQILIERPGYNVECSRSLLGPGQAVNLKVGEAQPAGGCTGLLCVYFATVEWDPPLEDAGRSPVAFYVMEVFRRTSAGELEYWAGNTIHIEERPEGTEPPLLDPGDPEYEFAEPLWHDLVPPYEEEIYVVSVTPYSEHGEPGQPITGSILVPKMEDDGTTEADMDEAILKGYYVWGTSEATVLLQQVLGLPPDGIYDYEVLKAHAEALEEIGLSVEEYLTEPPSSSRND